MRPSDQQVRRPGQAGVETAEGGAARGRSPSQQADGRVASGGRRQAGEAAGGAPGQGCPRRRHRCGQPPTPARQKEVEKSKKHKGRRPPTTHHSDGSGGKARQACAQRFLLGAATGSGRPRRARHGAQQGRRHRDAQHTQPARRPSLGSPAQLQAAKRGGSREDPQINTAAAAPRAGQAHENHCQQGAQRGGEGKTEEAATRAEADEARRRRQQGRRREKARPGRGEKGWRRRQVDSEEHQEEARGRGGACASAASPDANGSPRQWEQRARYPGGVHQCACRSLVQPCETNAPWTASPGVRKAEEQKRHQGAAMTTQRQRARCRDLPKAWQHAAERKGWHPGPHTPRGQRGLSREAAAQPCRCERQWAVGDVKALRTREDGEPDCQRRRAGAEWPSSGRLDGERKRTPAGRAGRTANSQQEGSKPTPCWMHPGTADNPSGVAVFRAAAPPAARQAATSGGDLAAAVDEELPPAAVAIHAAAARAGQAHENRCRQGTQPRQLTSQDHARAAGRPQARVAGERSQRPVAARGKRHPTIRSQRGPSQGTCLRRSKQQRTPRQVQASAFRRHPQRLGRPCSRGCVEPDQ